jgi:predicted transcriptional regulator
MRRGRTVRPVPPPLELACLRALWALGEAPVQAVRSHLLPERELAYTTVMTMLDRMTRKGLLGRRKAGRSFLYTPLAGREEIRRRAVEELVDSLFGGSREALRAYLAGTPEPVQSAPSEPEEEPEGLDATLL